MMSSQMPCCAMIARENRSLLDAAMRGHMKDCEKCIYQLIEGFIQEAGPDIEEDEGA